jgi:hypothetical protein
MAAAFLPYHASSAFDFRLSRGHGQRCVESRQNEIRAITEAGLRESGQLFFRLVYRIVERVGNTWVVDLRHFLTPDGTITDFPGRARAEHFASIAVNATANIDDIPSVQCRRRPHHQRCVGIVMSYLSDDKDESIHWYCSVCSDNGIIYGWQNTRWDRRAATTTVPSARRKQSQGL